MIPFMHIVFRISRCRLRVRSACIFISPYIYHRAVGPRLMMLQVGCPVRGPPRTGSGARSLTRHTVPSQRFQDFPVVRRDPDQSCHVQLLLHGFTAELSSSRSSVFTGFQRRFASSSRSSTTCYDAPLRAAHQDPDLDLHDMTRYSLL